jgi:DNA-binding LacI/PurR family transcriptional regulator
LLRQAHGFEKALQNHGCNLRPEQQILTGYDLEHGKKTFRQLMALRQPPTAIFFVTDALAIGAILAAQEAGIRIPQDVSILGFDNLPISKDIYPALTTLDKKLGVMMHEAIKLINQRIHNEGGPDTPEEAQSIVIDPELVIRQSCARKS